MYFIGLMVLVYLLWFSAHSFIAELCISMVLMIFLTSFDSRWFYFLCQMWDVLLAVFRMNLGGGHVAVVLQFLILAALKLLLWNVMSRFYRSDKLRASGSMRCWAMVCAVKMHERLDKTFFDEKPCEVWRCSFGHYQAKYRNCDQVIGN